MNMFCVNMIYGSILEWKMMKNVEEKRMEGREDNGGKKKECEKMEKGLREKVGKKKKKKS